MTRRYYPTPSDVKCYVNGVELDDMFRVDFNRQINHQPVYGYNDQQFGFVAKGKEIVSGQLILNFRYPGYLTAVMHRAAQKKILREQNPENYTDPINDKAFDGTTIAAKMKYVASQLQWEQHGTNQAIAEKLKAQYRKRFVRDTNSEPHGGRLDSPLDRGTHLFKFDLTVKYGQHDSTAGYTRVFKDCVITGESSVFSAAAGGNDMSNSAQPIFEIYPFFARTIDVDIYNREPHDAKQIRDLTEALRELDDNYQGAPIAPKAPRDPRLPNWIKG